MCKKICSFILGVVCIMLLSGVNKQVYAAEEATVEINDIIEWGDYCYKVDYTGNASYYKFYINGRDNTPFVGNDFYAEFLVPGGVYNLKIVPYNENDVPGVAKETVLKIPKINISNIELSEAYITNEDNGDDKPAIRINVSIDKNISNDMFGMEIYRSTNKNENFKKIADVHESFEYVDGDIELGIKYYYKVIPYVFPSYYDGDKNIYGEESKVYSINPLRIKKASVYAQYTLKGISINANSYGDGYVNGFYIYKSTKKNSGFKKICTIKNESYLDTNVKLGKTYYYKVKPFYYDVDKKKIYEGRLSEAVEEKADLSELNGYCRVTQIKKNTVKVEWNAIEGVKKYEVYARSTGFGAYEQKIATIKDTSINIRGFDENSEYGFRVKAYIDNKNYILLEGYIQMGKLSSPSNVKVGKRTIKINDNNVVLKETITWDKVYGATGYLIKSWENGKEVIIKKINNGNKNSYTLTNVLTTDGAKYDNVYVYALKGSQQSSSGSCNIVSGIIEGVKVKRLNNGSAKITWKKLVGADEYSIVRSGEDNFWGSEIGSTNKTSFIDNDVSVGKNYTYKISVACGKNDILIESEQVCYIHEFEKTKIISITNKKSRSAIIKWKKINNAKKYEVYRATSKEGIYKKIKTVKGTKFTDSKLKKGKRYYYKIVAYTVSDTGVAISSPMSNIKSVKIKK